MQRGPTRRWALGWLALPLIFAVECSAASEAISIESEGKRFHVRLTGLGRTEQTNHLHGFDLFLATIDDRAVVGASITLTGKRRYSPNPLPTSPQVRPGPADGSYRVEGLRFHMSGEWRLVFAIEFEQIHDRVTLDIDVKYSMEAVAPSLGVRLQQMGVPGLDEIEHVVGGLARSPNSGLIVLANRITITHRKVIIAAAAKHRLPAIYSYRYFVADGGLVSYGVDLIGLYRRTAFYVDRILKGEKPADLPVQQPTRYDLVINLTTAKALGLDVPPNLLARADEVLE